MPRALRIHVPRSLVALALVAQLLAGCTDQVKQAKDAAALRSQVEDLLTTMALHRTVPGLQHRQVIVEQDRDAGGFLIKIYEVKLGAPAIGFQSFSTLTFNVSEQGAGLRAQKFKFRPRPISDAPDTAPGMLIAQLKSWAASAKLPE